MHTGGRQGRPRTRGRAAFAAGAALLVLGGASAAARSLGDTEPALAPPEQFYAVPTRRDRVGRVMAPVLVNGRGPFRFILDTGANRSVLAERVLRDLGLQLAVDGPALAVHGVTGSAVLPAVRVEELRAGERVFARSQDVPVIPEQVLADADGILGIDGLRSSKITIDFGADTVTIAEASGARSPAGYLRLSTSLHHGGLMLVPGRVGKVRVKAIIDTGAERSLGNVALREALARRHPSAARGLQTSVLGATPGVHLGTSFVAPLVEIGDITLEGLEVTFGDLHVFRVWNLESEPALLIGMDMLGTVDRLVIDYRRREILVKPRP